MSAPEDVPFHRSTLAPNRARFWLGLMKRRIRLMFVPVPKGKRWLFIIGCYNSGTTLLSELAGLHPDIAQLPTEGAFLTTAFPTDFELAIPRMWIKREDLFRMDENSEGPDPDYIKREWAMRLDTSKPVFLEKSPPNTPRALWFQKHFEDAHFVAIVRDGYAVAEGIRRKAGRLDSEASWSIEDCARQWARSYEVIKEDEPKFKKLMWMRYEDLVEDPKRELDRMADFVGLPAFPPMAEDGRFTIHERSDAIANFNAESHSRLSAADIQAIEAVAADMLLSLNYPLLSAAPKSGAAP